MSNGNGKGEGEKKVLMCPFLKEYCIGGRCAVYENLMRVVRGQRQEVGVCGFIAHNALLSEINTALHQQRGVSSPKPAPYIDTGIVLPRG